MNEFSKSSKEKLLTCDEKIQLVFNTAIKYCPMDFGVSEGGGRPTKEQQQYFLEGKSTLDGIIKKSLHQFIPSRAIDIYAFVNGKASWEKEHLSFVAGFLMATAISLGVELEWGGFWKSFVDMPHFQIKK